MCVYTWRPSEVDVEHLPLSLSTLVFEAAFLTALGAQGADRMAGQQDSGTWLCLPHTAGIMSVSC